MSNEKIRNSGNIAATVVAGPAEACSRGDARFAPARQTVLGSAASLSPIIKLAGDPCPLLASTPRSNTPRHPQHNNLSILAEVSGKRVAIHARSRQERKAKLE